MEIININRNDSDIAARDIFLGTNSMPFKFLDSAINIFRIFLILQLGTYFGLKGKRTLKNTLTVFCFHDVSDYPGEFSQKYNLNVPPDLFDYQINFIKKNFNIIGPDDLLKDKLLENAALITFDDGFRSFFQNAIPILKKNNVPALIFLNMEPIMGEVFWSGLITYLCEKKNDFSIYLKSKLGEKKLANPLFLSCSASVVRSYLEKTNESFEKQVIEFVGEFADEGDLRSAAKEKLIYYGNHLYNHYVPVLMSDDELLDQYEKNLKVLNDYSNHRNFFSFPFGQPKSCFSDKQVDLLRQAGVEKVFYSSGNVNYDNSSFCIDRVGLMAQNNSNAKIWYQIFRHRLTTFFKKS